MTKERKKRQRRVEASAARAANPPFFPSYPVGYRIRTTDVASDLGFRALITRTQLDAVDFPFRASRGP